MVQIANCTLEEFERRAKASELICFGAGQAFLNFCEKFSLADHVKFVVDNYKYGTELQAGNLNIPIRAMDEVGDEVEEAMLVITSSRYVEDFVRQMDLCGQLDGKLVFCSCALPCESRPFLIDNTREKVIPKRIHYCWFGKGDMPKPILKNIDSWRKCCPDYDIIRWDEDNYDISKNLYMRQAYEHQMWSFASDYARLDVIYQYGGIYLDTDVEVLRPFDELLGYDMFCGFEDKDHINFGLGYGARSGHPIVKEMLDLYEDLSFVNEDGSLNRVPCPVYQTDVLKRHGLQANGLPQNGDHYLALSREYFSPFTSLSLGWITRHTFSIHQYAASWQGKTLSEDKNSFLVKHMVRLECGD